jgi:hypothetical protein
VSTVREVSADLLASDVVRVELPGLAAAVDDAVMAAHVQDALVGRGSSIVVERCELDQATYLGAAGVSLRYDVVLRDRVDDRTTSILVSGRLFPDSGAARTYLERRVLPLVPGMIERAGAMPFATPAAVIEPLGMVLQAFPLDGELPTLVGATDPTTIERILRPFVAELLPAAPPRGGTWRAQVVDYGRQGRCTLRYRLAHDDDGDPLLAIYGKVNVDGSGSDAAAITQLLRGPAQRWQPFAVPRTLAWVPGLKLAVLQEIAGSPTMTDAIKDLARGRPARAGGGPTAAEMIDDAARIAAAVHRAGPAPGAVRRASDELAWLDARIARVERASPELGALLRERRRRAAALLAAHGAAEPTTCHGDLTPGQMLFGGAETGLVDFDSVCRADPALDIGHFVAYLGVAAAKAPAGSAVAAELRERFLTAYDGAVGPADAAPRRARARSYAVVSLLRRVVRSWEKFKPDRVMGAVAMLDQVLDSGTW